MKFRSKVLVFFFTTLLTIVFASSVSAKEVTLGDIVEKFNNSNIVHNYGELLQSEFVASTNELTPNTLTISITTKKGNSSVNYELENSILSYEHLVDNNVITAGLLVDVIGQLHGYNDGEVLNNFNAFSDEIENYTVLNEGFEIKENGDYYIVKMNINKKVPLFDMSQFYLKPTEFDIIQEMVEDKEYGNQSGKNGPLVYDVVLGEDESYIYIGEPNENTESTYKSILSALEVMYNDKVVDYFKEIYSSIDEGSTIINGFDVDIDYDMDFEEHPMFSGTKVAFVKIDNKYINDLFFRTNYIEETIEKGDKTIELDFTKNQYKLGFFDSVSSSDVGFLYKYILEPVFYEANIEIDGDVVYFNVVNDKIVIGDKDNNIFKIVIFDDHFEILPSNTKTTKTLISAKHENVKSTEYESCDYGHDHHRYGNYNNVTINITYGEYEVLDQIVNAINGELTFKLNINYNKFLKEGKVYIDGKIVDSSNYTSKEGSTVITFNNDYVKQLSAGEHTLKVSVSDGEVETTFNTKTTNPQTEDNIIIYILTLLFSTIGIICSQLYIKKLIIK